MTDAVLYHVWDLDVFVQHGYVIGPLELCFIGRADVILFIQLFLGGYHNSTDVLHSSTELHLRFFFCPIHYAASRPTDRLDSVKCNAHLLYPLSQPHSHVMHSYDAPLYLHFLINSHCDCDIQSNYSASSWVVTRLASSWMTIVLFCQRGNSSIVPGCRSTHALLAPGSTIFSHNCLIVFGQMEKHLATAVLIVSLRTWYLNLTVLYSPNHTV